MTRTAHDALFKAAFATPEHARGILQVLLPPQLGSAITWSTLSCKPAGNVDPRLRHQRNDLRFTAELRRCAQPLHILFEHQSRVDERMVLRVLAYLVRIWERHPQLPLPPIAALVLSHEPEGWSPATQLRDIVAPAPDLIPALENFLPDCSLHVSDLSTLRHDDLIGWGLGPFPTLTLLLLRDARTPSELLRQHHHWLPPFGQLLASPHHEVPLSQLLHYLFAVLETPEFERVCALLTEHDPQTHETIMTKAESLLREGREQGIRQGLQQGLQWGREEGRLAELRDTLRGLITIKFGALSPAQTLHINEATTPELRTYIERLLLVPSVDALFTRPEAG